MAREIPVQLEPIEQYLMPDIRQIIVLYRLITSGKADTYCTGVVDLSRVTHDIYDAKDWCNDLILKAVEFYESLEESSHAGKRR